MTVHVWDNEENIVPPAEISSRLNLRESEDFLVKYKIAGILTETTIEGEDLTIFYIIIGVLALLSEYYYKIYSNNVRRTLLL